MRPFIPGPSSRVAAPFMWLLAVVLIGGSGCVPEAPGASEEASAEGDLDPLRPCGRQIGTVTAEAGNALAGVQILYPFGSSVAVTATDANGGYSLSHNPGPQSLTFIVPAFDAGSGRGGVGIEVRNIMQCQFIQQRDFRLSYDGGRPVLTEPYSGTEYR